MDRSSRVGLVVLGCALVLGFAGDRLLRVGPWGLGATVWAVALAAVCALVVAAFKKPIPWDVRLLVVPYLGFAGCLAWRDAASLRFLNILGLFTVLVVASARSERGQLWIGSVTQYTVGLLGVAMEVLGRFFGLFSSDIRWKELGGEDRQRKTSAVLRGALVAFPLLIVFTLLFSSADAVFSKFAADLFRWDFESLFISILLVPAFAWIAGAFLRQMLLPHVFGPPRDPLSDEKRVGITEIGIVLGSLDVLFLLFVAVQFRYFFGGHELVQSPIPLTYSEYAHKGVFELVTVCCLALAVLLVSNWLLRKDDARGVATFRGLAVGMVACLGVIMVSAFERIGIYMSAYGLSVLRFWVAVVILWLGAVFAWFTVTMLRGKTQHFAFGAVLAAFVAVLGANAFNPEAYVVSVNTARDPQKMDLRYLSELSADAVPGLVQAVPKMGVVARAEVSARMLDRWGEADFRDFRTSNAARASAAPLLLSNKAQLAEWAAPFQEALEKEKENEREAYRYHSWD